MAEREKEASGPDLETVIIYTERMEALAEFYRAGLGLAPFQPTGPDHLGQRVGSVYLGMDQARAASGGGAVSLWFTVDDIQATFDRLVSLGARVRSDIHRPRSRGEHSWPRSTTPTATYSVSPRDDEMNFDEESGPLHRHGDGPPERHELLEAVLRRS
jgi:predicted enzyme related to lactoylglutathione lyase